MYLIRSIPYFTLLEQEHTLVAVLLTSPIRLVLDTLFLQGKISFTHHDVDWKGPNIVTASAQIEMVVYFVVNSF